MSNLSSTPVSNDVNTSTTSTTSSSLVGLRYEIFGKVQGVFFRKFTKEKADSLGVVGYVLNTKQNTVKGEAQGTSERIEALKNWLEKEGSPKSRIVRAWFSEDSKVEKLSFSDFQIRK